VLTEITSPGLICCSAFGEGERIGGGGPRRSNAEGVGVGDAAGDFER